MATATSGLTRFATRGVTVLAAAPSVGATALSCVGRRASRSDAPPSSASFSWPGAELIRRVEAGRRSSAVPLEPTVGRRSVVPSPRGAENPGPVELRVGASRSTGAGALSVSGSCVVEGGLADALAP